MAEGSEGSGIGISGGGSGSEDAGADRADSGELPAVPAAAPELVAENLPGVLLLARSARYHHRPRGPDSSGPGGGQWPQPKCDPQRGHFTKDRESSLVISPRNLSQESLGRCQRYRGSPGVKTVSQRRQSQVSPSVMACSQTSAWLPKARQVGHHLCTGKYASRRRSRSAAVLGETLSNLSELGGRVGGSSSVGHIGQRIRQHFKRFVDSSVNSPYHFQPSSKLCGGASGIFGLFIDFLSYSFLPSFLP